MKHAIVPGSLVILREGLKLVRIWSTPDMAGARANSGWFGENDAAIALTSALRGIGSGERSRLVCILAGERIGYVYAEYIEVPA